MSLASRHGLLGMLIGLGLPAAATAVEMRLHGWPTPLAAQRGSPLLWFVDAVPLLLGGLAWMLGRRQDAVAAAESARARAYLKSASELSGASHTLSSSVQAFQSMTREATESVAQVTSTLEGLYQTAMRAALTAETVIGKAQRSARSSDEGLAAVGVATAGIAGLAEEARGFGERLGSLSRQLESVFAVTELLSEVAERSESLALEARLEAERAGEAGRGVGRVAEEMRAQAAEARSAAAGARGLIGEARDALFAARASMEEGRRRAEDGAAAAAGTGETIRRLAETVRESSDAAKQIALVAQEQDRGIDEALRELNKVALSLQDTVRSTERLAVQARTLESFGESLKRAVGPARPS